MWVSVCVIPGTLLSRPGITSAGCSCRRTRTMATRSNSPVTEYTSLTSGSWAIISATSGMRWMSALTRTIAVTTRCLLSMPGSGYLQPFTEVVQGADPARREPSDQGVEHGRGGACVGQGPVARLGRRAEERGQRGQLAVGHLVLAQKLPGDHHRVEDGEVRPAQPAVAAGGGQEAEIERRVVSGQHAAAGEAQQHRQHVGWLRSGRH